MKIYNLETKHQYILIQLLITFFILNKLIVLSSQYMDKNMIKTNKNKKLQGKSSKSSPAGTVKCLVFLHEKSLKDGQLSFLVNTHIQKTHIQCYSPKCIVHFLEVKQMC